MHGPTEDLAMIADGPRFVTAADGTRIAVWRSGAGPPLLLVHGTTADHTRWARVGPRFAQRFTVFTMDRRGRGASGDGPRYDIGREGADIAAVIEWIGATVNVVGHSYGALCCLEAAVRTASVRRLVLYEPPLPVGVPIVPRTAAARLESLIERGEREEALLVFFREVVEVPEQELQIMRGHPAWPGRVAAAHTVTREMRVEQEYGADPNRFRSVAAPTLLLLGGDSPASFRAATNLLADLLPDARIHEMAGQRHIAMDLVPEEFVRIVGDFAAA